MSTDTLLALAERCEREEPSPELDRTIWLAMDAARTYCETKVNHPKGPYVIDETREASGRLVIVPSYGSSLDAAVTLVPDDLQVSFWEINVERQSEAGTRASIFFEDGREFRADAKTAAVALCAAALRARAALSKTGA